MESTQPGPIRQGAIGHAPDAAGSAGCAGRAHGRFGDVPDPDLHPYVAAPDDTFTAPRPTRRVVLLGGLAAAVGAAGYSGYKETIGSALPRVATAAMPASAVTGISLPILPRDDGTFADGLRTFRLRLAPGKTSFIGGTEATTWGVNRAILGPVLHMNRGERVRMQVENQLGEPTTLHWHGMHLPAVMDGGPFQPIEPGATWEPAWEIRQSAATLWFHPHLLGKTRDHVMKGLAGIIAIHDPSEAGLPDRHGEDDFAIVLQENLLNDRGEIDTLDGRRVTLVNGAIAPTLQLPNGPARLRLLNASDARDFQLAFDDGRPLLVVGSDGGRLNNPVSVNDLIIGPGERVEIIVDHADARLIAINPDARQPSAVNAAVGSTAAEVLLQLEGGPTGIVPQTPFPSAPTPAELPDPEKATVNRHLVLDKGGPGLTIGMPSGPGGHDMSTMSSVVATPATVAGQAPATAPTAAAEELAFSCTLGSTEVWSVENKTDVVHFFHVHDVQFRVVDRDGAPPLEHELGRKDTVRIEAASTVRIALELTDYADPKSPYMFHCHMLTHEDQGMMGHFTVLEA